MKINRQLLSAILLISVCAPAVQADLVADPNEFKQLKRLTGFDKQKNANGKNVYIAPKRKDETKQAVGKTTEKNVKVDAKSDAKVNKANEKSSEKSFDGSKAKAATAASGDKSK